MRPSPAPNGRRNVSVDIIFVRRSSSLRAPKPFWLREQSGISPTTSPATYVRTPPSRSAAARMRVSGLPQCRANIAAADLDKSCAILPICNRPIGDVLRPSEVYAGPGRRPSGRSLGNTLRRRLALTSAAAICGAAIRGAAMRRVYSRAPRTSARFSTTVPEPDRRSGETCRLDPGRSPGKQRDRSHTRRPKRA